MYKLTNDPSLVIYCAGAITEDSSISFVPKGSNAWQDYQDWLNEGNIPEPADISIAVDPPNWVGFNAAFLGDVNWQTIANLFSTPDIRIGVAAAAGTANVQALIVAYNFAIADLTAQNIPLDPVVLTEWQEIADANNIPINFEVGN
jgi:hypothetical protein